MRDLHLLPKLRDSLSYVYIEHAVIEQRDGALLVLQETGKTTVPASNLCLLMLGPGTSMTHAAIRLAAENGCSVVWVGQDGEHFYAQGMGETRRGYHLLHQAKLATDPDSRLSVVLRMYEKRFGYSLDPGLSIEQIRGKEGVRMRNAYAECSKMYGVPWEGRNYDRSNWGKGDAVNRALSAANALLNGICHAAIVSGGYSPGLGFIHTGLQLSFVYDIADLYKTMCTIPLAFQTVADGPQDVEKRVRQLCRDRFQDIKLLSRILPDIDTLLGAQADENFAGDEDLGRPEPLWDPEKGCEEENDQEGQE